MGDHIFCLHTLLCKSMNLYSLFTKYLFSNNRQEILIGDHIFHLRTLWKCMNLYSLFLKYLLSYNRQERQSTNKNDLQQNTIIKKKKINNKKEVFKSYMLSTLCFQRHQHVSILDKVGLNTLVTSISAFLRALSSLQ